MMTEGGKRVENRDWRYPPDYLVGNYVAWHTAKGFDANGASYILRNGYTAQQLEASKAGFIVGVSRVEAVITHPAPLPASHSDQERWYFGTQGILLSKPLRLATPVFVARGALGWWKLPPEAFVNVMNELSETQRFSSDVFDLTRGVRP